jgi:hypothetical protein
MVDIPKQALVGFFDGPVTILSINGMDNWCILQDGAPQ